MPTSLRNQTQTYSNGTPQMDTVFSSSGTAGTRLTTNNAVLPGPDPASYVLNHQLGVPATSDITKGFFFTGPLDPHTAWELCGFVYEDGVKVNTNNKTAQYALYGIREFAANGNREYGADLLFETDATAGLAVVAVGGAIIPEGCSWIDTFTTITDYTLGGITIRNKADGRALATGDGEGYLGYMIVCTRKGVAPAAKVGFALRTF